MYKRNEVKKNVAMLFGPIYNLEFNLGSFDWNKEII